MKFDVFSYNLVRCLPHYPARQRHILDQFGKISGDPKNPRCNIFYGFNLDYTLKRCIYSDDVIKLNKDRERQVRYLRGLPGGLGCTVSFNSCINIAKLANFPYLFCFEDDIFFCEDFLKKLEENLNELPDNFEICLLGRNRDDFEVHPYSEHLIKADNIHNNGAFGILINRIAYDKILLDFAKNPMLLVDDFWFWQKYDNCFATKERLILSSPESRYSTIEAREFNKLNKLESKKE